MATGAGGRGWRGARERGVGGRGRGVVPAALLRRGREPAPQGEPTAPAARAAVAEAGALTALQQQSPPPPRAAPPQRQPQAQLATAPWLRQPLRCAAAGSRQSQRKLGLAAGPTHAAPALSLGHCHPVRPLRAERAGARPTPCGRHRAATGPAARCTPRGKPSSMTTRPRLSLRTAAARPSGVDGPSSTCCDRCQRRCRPPEHAGRPAGRQETDAASL